MEGTGTETEICEGESKGKVDTWRPCQGGGKAGANALAFENQGIRGKQSTFSWDHQGWTQGPQAKVAGKDRVGTTQDKPGQ